MLELEKRLAYLKKRFIYLSDIKGEIFGERLEILKSWLKSISERFYELPQQEIIEELEKIANHLSFYEREANERLNSLDYVRIVRHPFRITLKDILENVYDDYVELGGKEECNIDPAIIAARATISRKVADKIYTHQVMVIGHEKGHGEEFRNGGSAKPWGNEKALRFMKVAEIEGIPIHTYIFTPGAYPIEDYPGAAQQIARNLYAMAGLKVPIITFISEGGSGGAEAIGLADLRLMFSHGYYSVISPEGAAAIEGKASGKDKIPPELILFCADQLKITAQDNLRLGTIDRIIWEPPLGAKDGDYDFFKSLKEEIIKATDETYLSVKGLSTLRAYQLKKNGIKDTVNIYVRWELDSKEIERLLTKRVFKYKSLTEHFYANLHPWWQRGLDGIRLKYLKIKTFLFFHGLKCPQKRFKRILEDIKAEAHVILSHIIAHFGKLKGRFFPKKKVLPFLAAGTSIKEEDSYLGETYVSPLANVDKTVNCPNTDRYGCYDIWVPDLYGELCGICPNCNHHFPLEYQWYLNCLFDKGSIREFYSKIASINAIDYQGFDEKLKGSRKKSGRYSALITFDAKVKGISIVIIMIYSDFRNGTIGAAEGKKIVLACERAQLLHYPLLAYVHGTAGIRIHEGTVGVVQMPKCTVAVREYIEAGGLYIVVYDNNSYAGPVASFLGCSPYQFAIHSCRIGFAGPRVIRETIGQEVPPDYHSASNALKRGHIQGIWDRRDFRKNLYLALLTMGGKFLYYR
jgi:acetyl-CoA carboxylase carboxyl transferase subunit beta